MTRPAFLKLLTEFYTTQGRHDLPWRQSQYLDPYSIVVSEIMLQQTQVSRVVDYFQKWMIQFPDITTLAAASSADVLSAWQGLGYNNRGLRLKRLAEVILSEYGGSFPRDRRQLELLPGIGPYTAGAVRAFVWDEPDEFIETNIRRVFIHHFFADRESVSDTEIIPLIERCIAILKPGTYNLTPREFYWALMDYGAHLGKSQKDNPNRKSKTYTKQSRFEGSVRQVRSGIVKHVLEYGSLQIDNIAHALGVADPDDVRIGQAVDGLLRDKIITIKKDIVTLCN